MWHDGRLGRRGPTPSDGSSWRFAPPDPAMLAHLDAALPAMMADYESSRPPHGDAQVRLRSGPDGRRGLWVDASRSAIDTLLAERDWLFGRLAAGWIVELGQRGEAVTRSGDALQLATAEPHPWLPGRDAAGRPIPLVSRVASFTQPGPAINAALLTAAGQLLDDAGVGRVGWREFGSGYGNITAWLADRLGPAGIAFENDPRSRGLLERNGAAFFPDVRLDHRAGDSDLAGDDPATIWIVDPPRPGFPALLAMLAERRPRPAHVLALHCHPVGLAADAAALRAAGYAPAGWRAVDAFPGTPFIETVEFWSQARQV
jgi:hypothetical protein